MRSRLEVASQASTSTYTIISPVQPTPLLDLCIFSSLAWAALQGGYWTWSALVLAGLWFRIKTSTVLEESILAIKGLGLQLSTTRGVVLGLPFISDTSKRIPLSTSRLFLPLSSVSDVVINEGIWRWQIIYYLVIIQNEGEEGAKLRIGFSELLPRLDEVRRTWIGLRHCIFDELQEDEAM